MIRKLRLKIVGISVIAVAVLLVSVLAAVALLALAGGGAFAYVKFIKPNRSGVKVSADPDEYDFPDEEYINEDENTGNK